VKNAVKLSVVVCTFNRSEYLRRMLNSLREAVIPDNLSCEYIVGDNNSDDQTRLVLKEFNKDGEPTLKYVLERKSGLSYARNRGIREGKVKLSRLRMMT
jgi:glucosyl-dolichyl phosphate glucuronosyltransferase